MAILFYYYIFWKCWLSISVSAASQVIPPLSSLADSGKVRSPRSPVRRLFIPLEGRLHRPRKHGPANDSEPRQERLSGQGVRHQPSDSREMQ